MVNRDGMVTYLYSHYMALIFIFKLPYSGISLFSIVSQYIIHIIINLNTPRIKNICSNCTIISP